MITEDFVQFGIAKLLREKGFDEYGRFYYFEPRESPEMFPSGREHRNSDNVYGENTWIAPTLQMARKWLREMHHIDIDILSRLSLNADNDHCYSYIIQHQYDPYHYNTYTDGEYLTYEETCDAAVKYCLENLI